MRQMKIAGEVITERSDLLNRYFSDICELPLVTAEQEEELSDRIRQGDEEALQSLVKANLRFVVSVAKQYRGQGLDLTDLINEGNLGLIKAARLFDPTRGFKFISYAVWWIRQSIMQAVSENQAVVRLPLNKVAVLNRINRQGQVFQQQHQREPSIVELCDILGLKEDAVRDVINYGRASSLDMKIGEDGDSTLIEFLPNTQVRDTDAGLLDESLKDDLTSVLQVLNDREREVIVKCFGIGMQERTLEEVSQEMGISRERVRQLRETGLKKLRRPGVKGRLAEYV